MKMKKILSLNVMKNREIHKAAQQKKKNLIVKGTYFFPVLFSVWEVTYKSFFRKVRRSRTVTGADLVRGGPGMADQFPSFSEMEADHTAIIDPALSPVSQSEECKEFIRNYYIHYKRIWTPPGIQLVQEEIIHMPYTILLDPEGKSERKKYFLLEHSSGHLDLLVSYPHIKDRCLGVMKGGDWQ
jgi:hypothetical protein